MNPHRIDAAVLTSVIAFGLFCAHATGQTTAQHAEPAQPAQQRLLPICSTGDLHIFYLRNATQQSEANELYTATRQFLLPDTRSFFIPAQNAIAICGSSEQVAIAQKALDGLDRRTKKNYRLTYTVTETDGDRKISSQNYSLIVSPGQDSTLKQGSRVPIVTGSTVDKGTMQQNVSYVDVGMNFTASVDETADGVRLRTGVEQSSIAGDKSGATAADPVLRQATFRGASYVSPGKPLKLGTLDLPDGSRHLEIVVTMESLP